WKVRRATTPPSPECGPVPVTRVPRQIARADDTARTGARARTQLRSTPATRPGRSAAATVTSEARRLRPTSTAATATTIAEHTKWIRTTHGFSRVRTVMPPTTACTTMPPPIAPASSRSSGWRRRERQTASTVSTAMITRRKVSSRLPNSMTPCRPISGVLVQDSSVHRGQVGQPRPLPVSRTAPPVTMSRALASIEAQAVARTQPVTSAGTRYAVSRRRAEVGAGAVVMSPRGAVRRSQGQREEEQRVDGDAEEEQRQVADGVVEQPHRPEGLAGLPGAGAGEEPVRLHDEDGARDHGHDAVEPAHRRHRDEHQRGQHRHPGVEDDLPPDGRVL